MINNIKNAYKGLLLAFGFLTVFPVSKTVDWTPDTMRRALHHFPLCGTLAASLAAVIAMVSLSLELPVYAVGFLVLMAFVVVSGGLHLDGWMDVSDAVLSWKPREEKLAVMKDPLVGSGAVWTTILLLGGKYTAIVTMLDTSLVFFFTALFAVPVLSRAGMGAVVSRGRLLSSTGLAASFQQSGRPSDVRWLAGITILSLLPALYFSLFLTISLAVISMICTLALYRFFVRKLGGVNGDTAGASLEGTEAVLWWSAAVLAVIL
ncbi:cobalamin-5'-phosphate synthase [Sinobaca qinghaiensis]|uniref:Adenosylcobinamide-GDP ribazoletransferase n=1 Tax=Sinobaca qinghaiensis TaxID=342944 RepID=A0A419V347_9BACL|nr:adenosylcobinamide-GDP ribazoletransferase [Sinobaca qinghaiensis]RKD72890.1 cobalamin-5'-phosphate synthase [Sinobaca qinghaiensis]